MEAPANKRRARAKQFNLQVSKFQATHFIACTLITVAISLERGLPTGHDSAPRIKSQVWRIPVPLHERFKVLTIPCLNLAIQHHPDLLHRARLSLLLLLRLHGCGHHHYRDEQSRRRHFYSSGHWISHSRRSGIDFATLSSAQRPRLKSVL